MAAKPGLSHVSMSAADFEAVRILAEYERRGREIPVDFYCWSRPANLLMHQQTARSCVRLLTRAGMFPLRDQRIADIGCGEGTWLLEFLQWGADPANLSGIDLVPARVERARWRIPRADIRLGNAVALPWPDRSFDLLTQFMLFMNILVPELKQAIANEMLRVLKPGGAILWFDLRVDNPRNPQARGVRAAEIHSLFAGCAVELAPTVLAPPLSRLIAGWAWPVAEGLHALRFFCTHYAGLIRRPDREAPLARRKNNE